MGNNAKAMIDTRKAAVADMNAPLLRELGLLEHCVNDSRVGNIMYYYNVGTILFRVREDPDKYSGRGSTLLRDALSLDERIIRDTTLFVRMMKEDELKQLIALRNKEASFCLNWGHVRLLLGVATKRSRLSFAKYVIKDCWSPGDLAIAIQKVKADPKPKHGRKHELPGTLTQQLNQISTVTGVWSKKVDQVWNGTDVSVFTNLTSNEAESNLTPDHLEAVRKIQEQMIKVEEQAIEMREMAQGTIHHIELALQRRLEATKPSALPKSNNTGTLRGRAARALAVARGE